MKQTTQSRFTLPTRMPRFAQFTLAALLLLGMFNVARFTLPVQAQDTDFSDGITVDSTLDTSDANISDGICDDGAGNCTLRAAIDEANSNPDASIIKFGISGTGVHTITPDIIYHITSPVTIDGYSQPGASANTAPAPQPFNGTLTIEIDGSGSASLNCFYIPSGTTDVNLKGLVINRFQGSATAPSGGGSNTTIQGSYIGTDPTGLLDEGNLGTGVLLGADAQIGGLNPQDRNIISGNDNGGGNSNGGDDHWVIQGNYIGVGADGLTAIPNAQPGGAGSFSLDNSSDHIVGGPQSGAINVIAGNDGHGLAPHNSPNILIEGNYIGVGYDGVTPVGNGAPGGGIVHTGAGPNPIIKNNVIANSASDGIYLADIEGGEITGNIIGLDSTETSAQGNGQSGINITRGKDIVVGGTGALGNHIANSSFGGVDVLDSESISILGNTIEDNLGSGIYLAGTSGVTIQSNTIQGNVDGINISGGVSNALIGGAAVDEGNIIANNAQAGIVLRANDNQDISILGNKIYENDGLGVDIYDDGPTLNDNLDADTGANTILNFPRVITPQTISGGDTDIMYTTNLPAGDYRIEFFSNTTADPSGYGEGEAFMGFQNITSTGTGEQIFNTSIVGTSFANIRATATLIDPSTSSGFGPTSEFGDQTTAPTDIAISKTITNLEDVTPGGVIEYDISFINNGPFPAQLADFSDANSGKLLLADHAAPDLMPADEGAFAGLPGSFVISDTGNADVTCAWLGPGSSGSVMGLVAYGDHGAIVCYYSGSDTILASGDSIDVHLRFNVDSGSNLKFSNYVISSAPISTSDPDVAAIGSATADELLDRNPDVNNVAIASTTGLNVDLSLDKTLQDPEDFAQGGTITYQISLNNLGPDWFDPSIYDDFFSRQIFVDYVDPDITPANLGGPGPAPGITVIADTGNPDIECLWGDHGSAPFLGAPDHPDYGLIFCRYIGDEVVKSGESISAEIDFQIANDSDLSFNNYAFNAGTLIVQGGDPDDAEIMTVYNSGGDILSGFIQAGGNINNFAVGQPPVDIGVTATFVNPEDVAVGNTIYYDVTLLNRGPGAVDMSYFNDFSRGILGGAFAIANLDIVGAVGSDFICADAGSGSIQYLGVAAQDHTNYSVYMCMYSGSGQVLAAGESQTIRLAFTVTDPADGFNFYAINASFSTDPGMNTFTNEFYGATQDVLDTFTHDNFARVAYTLTGNGGGGTSNNGTGGNNSVSSEGGLSATGQSRLVIVAIAATLLVLGITAALIARKRQLKQ